MADQMPTPMTADMAPADIAAMFNTQFGDMKSRVRERQKFLPRISLTVPKTTFKDKKGVAVGDWYLTPADTAQGEEPKYVNLGPAFEPIAVLHDDMTMSMRDDDTGKTLMESTPFQNYSGEPIFLMDGRDGPLHMKAVAPYSGAGVHTMKKLQATDWWPKKQNKKKTEEVSALGTNYNVYVLLEDGTVAILNNTKRGYLGTYPDSGETAGFGDVTDDSFVRARANCHIDTPGLTLAHRWKIHSVQVGGGADEPRPAFKVFGLQDPAKVKDIREAAEWLQKYLLAKWADKIAYAWNNTSPAARAAMVSSYVEIRPLLDQMGGNEVAAQIILGKHVAPALLSEPEPNYAAIEEENAADTAKKIEELGQEHENEKALPTDGIIEGKITVPDINYKPEISVEDLPF